MSRLSALLVLFALAPTTRAADEEQLDWQEPPAAYAVGMSHAVVVGEITKIEKETVKLKSEWHPDETVAHKVAVIKVETGIEGAKAGELLKVTFPAKKPEYSGRVSEVDRPLPHVLKNGQKGLFFLSRRSDDKDYFFAPAGFSPIPASSKRFDQKVADAKTAVATIADPKKALTAAAEHDRLAAASAIIARIRWRDQKAFPAELTKLVLKTVLETDWHNKGELKDWLPYAMSGPGLVSMLSLRPGDILTEVKANDGENYTDLWKKAVAAWYEKAGDKLEIKPFVCKTKE